MKYLSINKKYIASNVVGQLCVDQASFIYQDLNIDAIFFIPPANTGCAILLYIFMFYVQTCIFFLLVTTLATCSYLLLGEWPSYRIELTRHYYLEGNTPPPPPPLPCCVFVARGNTYVQLTMKKELLKPHISTMSH